jgi:hypothetical protein
LSTPDDLPEDFAALREHDRARAPAFDAMMTAPPARRTSPLVYVIPAGAAAAAALAMAAAFVLWIAAARSFEPPSARAPIVASDPEPLGFLLDEPAALARVPDFDSSPTKEPR